MTTLEDYKTWLQTQKYSESTIEASLKVLRRLDSDKPAPSNRVDEFLLRRYLRFVKETRRNPLGKKFTEALAELGLNATTPRAVYGQRKRKLLSSEEFYELKNRCFKSKDRITLLVGFYMMSGKKPRDFLMQSSGESLYSDVFRVKRDKPLYETLSPSLTWAYRRLLAAAKREGRALNVDVDLDILYRSRLDLRG